jgi:hypothetical protein
MRRFRPSHPTVIAYLALLVALGGTAYASVIVTSNSQVAKGTISGHHPPTGDHANIIGGSVNGTDLAANSVDGSKVLDGSLTGADVQANSLTGTNINAGTLGEVARAQIGGFGRYSGVSLCDPAGSTDVDCVILTVNLPQQSKVLLIGSVEAAADGSDSIGGCVLATQFGDVPSTAFHYIVNNGEEVGGSLVGITGQLGPGSVDFAVDCNNETSDMDYVVSLAAVQISPD